MSLGADKMAGSTIRGVVGRLVGGMPHEVKAIAEDAVILALIVVAEMTLSAER